MDRKKIMIIDDEEDFTKMVKANLERAGDYEVRTESKGLLGYLAAKEFRPDLIFLDILMPDVEGGEIAARLREDKDTRDIPVVFLTAVATHEQVKEAGGVIGGHPFIAKPVTTRELIDCIEKRVSSTL